MVYNNSSLNSTEIDGGNASSEPDYKITKKRNQWMNFGVYLIIFSSIVQIISHFI